MKKDIAIIIETHKLEIMKPKFKKTFKTEATLLFLNGEETKQELSITEYDYKEEIAYTGTVTLKPSQKLPIQIKSEETGILQIKHCWPCNERRRHTHHWGDNVFEKYRQTIPEPEFSNPTGVI